MAPEVLRPVPEPAQLGVRELEMLERHVSFNTASCVPKL
jgi:hypothetical protein